MNKRKSDVQKSDQEAWDRASIERLKGQAHLKKIKEGMTSETGQMIQKKVIQEALRKTSKAVK